MSQIVRVKNQERILGIPVINGFLSLKTLKKYYPDATGLTYQENNETVAAVFKDDDLIEVNPKISIYEVYIPEDVSQNINIKVNEKIVAYFHKDYSYQDICNLLLKRHNCNMSLRSLKRFLKMNGLKRKNIIESSVEQIVAAIHIELQNSGFNLGYNMLWKKLRKEYNLIVKQKTVLCILQIIDPEGIAERKRNRLRRRIYSVSGPNYMWHIDGYDKIKRYGFALHGCIDGYSKKILWLKVGTTNNNPHVIAYYYLETVRKYQCVPTIIRSDKGTENSVIANLQKCLRSLHQDEHAGEKSYVSGKSTANQRIESSWCQLRRHVCGFYINLFKEMEDRGIIDINIPLHVETLRYSFGPMIRHDLQMYRKQWNEHHIRRQNNRNVTGGKPNIMYNLPEKFGVRNCKKFINNEQIGILQGKYAIKPVLFKASFANILKQIMPDAAVPCTAQEACILYLNVIETFKSNSTNV